jgi:hypothetical protein
MSCAMVGHNRTPHGIDVYRDPSSDCDPLFAVGSGGGGGGGGVAKVQTCRFGGAAKETPPVLGPSSGGNKE